MKYIKLFLILLSLGSQPAKSEISQRKGICVLDRTVESYDFRTWVSAKSRAMPDYIPIKFNSNLLYLGPEEAERFVFINRETDPARRNIISLYESNELNSSIMLYYPSEEAKEKPFIIYSKGVAPYFFGECELKNTGNP